MAKPYNKKGKVHPSPPSVADQLALLPAAILTLAAALPPDDREVLAYLISRSNDASSADASGRRGVASDGRKNAEHDSPGGEDHPPMFQCDCFRCYKSFWSRWDASPNRQAIDEIIEAHEDGLFRDGGKSSSAKKKKKQRKGQNRVADCGEDRVAAERRAAKDELGEQEIEGGAGGDEPEAASGGGVEDGEAGSEKGTLRKIASFIAEKIWGLWNRK